MKSYGMTMLFAEPRQLSSEPYSLVLSVLVHAGVIVLLSLGFIYAPKITGPSRAPRYSMRLLELHMPDPPVQRKKQASADSDSEAAQQAAHQMTKDAQAQPTLIQPDISTQLVLPQKIPLPLLMMRPSEDSLAKLIVPPAQQLPAAANVKPVLEMPNREEPLADIKIASSAFGKDTLPILPSTTSPVVVRGPEPNKLPETASKSTGQPSPVKVMSFSDLRMKDGTVPLPRANEIGSATSPGSPSPGQQTGASQGDKGADANASGSGKGLSTRRITPPKDGKFGMVVVGGSLAEQYPETAEVWSGRMAYTVYLHVGLPKNWILQYSQPRSAEAAATGGSAHLEAPWPTDMVVPNLAPGAINSDALLVQGFLNKEGRFEKLTIAYPPDFALAKFVLNSLQQWQFRPATQNGQATTVEVLLIIPEIQE